MKRGCRWVREVLLSLPDEGPAAAPPQVTRHLESCRQCRTFWEDWRVLGPALRALDLPEPVDRGRIVQAIARADAGTVLQAGGRPLVRDLVPALLLSSVILAIQAEAWILWGVAGLAGIQGVSGALLPLAVLAAVRHDFAPPGRETP